MYVCALGKCRYPQMAEVNRHPKKIWTVLSCSVGAGNEPGFPGRVASALKHRAIFSAPDLVSWIPMISQNAMFCFRTRLRDLNPAS